MKTHPATYLVCPTGRACAPTTGLHYSPVSRIGTRQPCGHAVTDIGNVRLIAVELLTGEIRAPGLLDWDDDTGRDMLRTDIYNAVILSGNLETIVRYRSVICVDCQKPVTATETAIGPADSTHRRNEPCGCVIAVYFKRGGREHHRDATVLGSAVTENHLLFDQVASIYLDAITADESLAPSAPTATATRRSPASGSSTSTGSNREAASKL